jgi:hypothetical protein
MIDVGTEETATDGVRVPQGTEAHDHLVAMAK